MPPAGLSILPSKMLDGDVERRIAAGVDQHVGGRPVVEDAEAAADGRLAAAERIVREAEARADVAVVRVVSAPRESDEQPLQLQDRSPAGMRPFALSGKAEPKNARPLYGSPVPGRDRSVRRADLRRFLGSKAPAETSRCCRAGCRTAGCSYSALPSPRSAGGCTFQLSWK